VPGGCCWRPCTSLRRSCGSQHRQRAARPSDGRRQNSNWPGWCLSQRPHEVLQTWQQACYAVG
jgi:hypothetical protein